jgi:hypothetical protein
MHMAARFLPVGVLVMSTMVSAAASSEPSLRPFWTEQAMFRFGDELFFTGRASCAPSAEEGRQRAYESAVREVLNYTRSSTLVGMPIETQMLFEEPPGAGCPAGGVTVWRLLRIPRLPLNALAAHARDGMTPRVRDGGARVRVKDLSLRIGLSREEVWKRFGQPRSVMMRRSTSEIHYDYPQFGLTLALDQQGGLLHWHLAAPQSAAASRPSPYDWHDWPEEGSSRQTAGAPPLDLTDRLRELEERNAQELTEDARAICARRWRRNTEMQRTCEPYEYEHLKRLESQQRR